MKSFIEKLNNKKDIKIVESLSGNISWADEGNSMVVSTPLEIWSIIKLIPAFKVANIDSIRNFLSYKHSTDIACPLTTGIFLNICANASQEYKLLGKEKKIIPWWRTIKNNGDLNPKYPNSFRLQSELLEKENWKINYSKKTPRLVDFENRIFEFN